MNEIQRLKKKTLGMLAMKPRTVSLEVTTHCPLKCKYCSRTKEGSGFKSASMSDDRFGLLKQRIKGFERVVMCGLGESLTHPGFYQMVASLKQRITLITSGTMAIDYRKLNRKRNLETVMFSLDAPSREEMMEITGNYNWPNLMQNFQRSRYNRSTFLGLNCTLFKTNYHRAEDLTRFAIAHKLNAINFNNAITDREDTGLKEKVYDTLEAAEINTAGNNLIFTTSFKHLSCTTNGIPVPLVTVEGDVYPCCIATDKSNKVGNIFESTFDQIWNSPSYDYFKSGELCFGGCSMFNDVALGKKHEKLKHSLN